MAVELSRRPRQQRSVRFDADLVASIRAAHWRSSKGFVSKGEWVGPHEYVIFYKDQALFEAIRERLKAPDAWVASYHGSRVRYVELDGWRYWITWPAANREQVPPNAPVCRGCHRRHLR